MSTQEMAINGLPEFHGDLTVKSEEQASDMDHDGDGYLINGNAVSGFDGTHDQLVQMVIELNFQNLYLKSHIEGLKSIQLDSGGISVSGNVKELHEKIESLNRELLEHKQAQVAAEDALKHLRESYSEADAKAQQLSAKLSEVEQKMDQEIKERDDKYNELDSKFGRLHKRAKQRIQDVQKEKDDLEARLRDVNEMAERASSQQAFLQQELERSQKQANETLRVMDVERQQLRTANNKFRETIDEVRRSLEAKENTLEGLQKSLLEKEQMLEDMRGLLQAADEKRQSSISELSVKHQKNLESLEAQLADVLADRSKADETISALRVSVAEKESKIAEMEAASTGEAVRLGAALETVKGELGQLKLEHEKDKESWEAANKALKTKLEMSESACIRSEIEAAKMRSQLELELSVQNQLLNSKDADLATAKEEICRLESEFSAYKVRAHALLQKKDAEIAAAKDSELLQAQEEALNKAEKEVALAAAERDTAIQELQDVLAKHDKELAARDAALSDAEQQIKSIQQKLDSVHTHYQAQREAWESNLQNLEESWRLKCQALENQANSTSWEDLQNELEGLKLHYQKLKEEHDSFRDIADRMIEEKDKEISRLLNDNKILQRSIGSRPSVDHNGNHYSGDTQVSNTSAAEQQILILARQQAQREEELAQSQRHILALQEEIEELERENRLHGQQEAMLKAELRNMERMQKREGVDMTYLKNVILKLLETGEVDALLPVIGMLLQFSPEEVQKCQQASRTRSSTDVPPSPASDASASGLSLFSRFSLS